MKHTPLHLLAVGGLALLLSACADTASQQPSTTPAAPATPAQNKKPGDRYTLRPTDILRVELFQEPDFRPEVSVTQEGDVVLPLVGKVQVAGKTVNEVQIKLTERFREFYKEPNVTLLILKYAERKVYIDGMVGRPGPVLFPPEENLTISRAIAGASGILPRGERSDITVTRVVNGATQVIKVDMNEVSRGEAPDIELKENDRIYVRDSRI